jgi:hypothetical protein
VSPLRPASAACPEDRLRALRKFAWLYLADGVACYYRSYWGWRCSVETRRHPLRWLSECDARHIMSALAVKAGAEYTSSDLGLCRLGPRPTR